MFPRCSIHNVFMGSCREEHHQPARVNVVSTNILSDKWFRSKSGTYQRQSAALGCGAARGTAALEGVDGGGVGSWRKEKKISVWVDSRRYKGGYLRASQVTSTTPSTSAWQQRGVSSAGQTEPGARSWIMAGIAAAMAAKARMVNCILAFEGFW